MTGEFGPSEEREKEIPRWAQICIGLALGLLTLALGFASTVGLLIIPNEKAPILAIAVGLALLLVCVWVLEKCLRLVAGRKNRGGLMSPTTLRVLSVFFLLLPVAGLFNGYYRRMEPVAMFQAVMYFFAFLALRKLAWKREAAAAGKESVSHSHDNC